MDSHRWSTEVYAVGGLPICQSSEAIVLQQPDVTAVSSLVGKSQGVGHATFNGRHSTYQGDAFTPVHTPARGTRENGEKKLEFNAGNSLVTTT